MTTSSPEAAPAYSDDFLRGILSETKTIAVVGFSADAAKPSHYVAKFLQQRGYRVVGVNPGLGGKDVDGVTVYGTLTEIPFPIDMVDVFRNSEAAGQVVDEALALSPKAKVIWMQLDVINAAAAERAQAQGLKVVMNHCPKIEILRLF